MLVQDDSHVTSNVAADGDTEALSAETEDGQVKVRTIDVNVRAEPQECNLAQAAVLRCVVFCCVLLFCCATVHVCARTCVHSCNALCCSVLRCVALRCIACLAWVHFVRVFCACMRE